MSQSVASNGGGGGGGSVASASSSSAAVAQQEAALRKLEAERDRLVAEVLTLQEAMSTSKACEELVKYVESTPEPFAEGGKDGGTNPWTQQVVGGTQCCVVA